MRIACGLSLVVVVLISYQPALQLNFYGDDYSFVEFAGRASLWQYLTFYFDPRLQTGWYRPIQGMLFGIEWVLFKGNPLGYHLVNILTHIANVLLLFALVTRVTKNWRTAWISALVYAGLPLISVAVFWPGDADFLLTFFYLGGLLAWILYLQYQARRFFFTVLVMWLLALLTKEFGVTLPVIFFLADRLLWRKPSSLSILSRRYFFFVVVYLIYLPLELYIQSHSVLTNIYGYGIASHVISNTIHYAAWLAFPWGLPEPVNWVWLTIVVLVLGLLVKQDRRMLFLALATPLTFGPAVPFPWFFTRYLYLAVMASSTLIASLFEWIASQRAGKFAPIMSMALALIVFANAQGVGDAASAFAELGRQTRVPFRDMVQRHTSFPDDTYLYFIDPPTITSQLSGMFFLRYGASIRVSSNTASHQRADLRDHAYAYVIYFDAQRRTREVPVEKQIAVTVRPVPPVDLGALIQLEDLEMPCAHTRRGDAFVVILYWKAAQVIEKQPTVFVRLINQDAQVVANAMADPCPQAHQTGWRRGELCVDARVLGVPSDALPSPNYRIQVGLLGNATLEDTGVGMTDIIHIVEISPLTVID